MFTKFSILSEHRNGIVSTGKPAQQVRQVSNQQQVNSKSGQVLKGLSRYEQRSVTHRLVACPIDSGDPHLIRGYSCHDLRERTANEGFQAPEKSQENRRMRA